MAAEKRERVEARRADQQRARQEKERAVSQLKASEAEVKDLLKQQKEKERAVSSEQKACSAMVDVTRRKALEALKTCSEDDDSWDEIRERAQSVSDWSGKMAREEWTTELLQESANSWRSLADEISGILTGHTKGHNSNNSSHQPAQLGAGVSANTAKLALSLDADLKRSRGRPPWANDVMGVAGLMASARSAELAKTLGQILSGYMRTVILRKRSAKSQLPKQYKEALPVLAIDNIQKRPPVTASPTAAGCLGYAWELIQLAPEHQELRNNVYRSLLGDVLVFDTEEHAIAYRKTKINSVARIANIYTLDGGRIDSSGVEHPRVRLDSATCLMLAVKYVPQDTQTAERMKTLVGDLRKLADKADTFRSALIELDEEMDDIEPDLLDAKERVKSLHKEVDAAVRKCKEADGHLRAAVRDLEEADMRPSESTSNGRRSTRENRGRGKRSSEYAWYAAGNAEAEEDANEPELEPPRRRTRRSL